MAGAKLAREHFDAVRQRRARLVLSALRDQGHPDYRINVRRTRVLTVRRVGPYHQRIPQPLLGIHRTVAIEQHITLLGFEEGSVRVQCGQARSERIGLRQRFLD